MLLERLLHIQRKTRDHAYSKCRSFEKGSRISADGSECYRLTALFVQRCKEETPVVFSDERIAGLQTKVHLSTLRDDALGFCRKILRYAVRRLMSVVWKVDTRRNLCPLRTSEDYIHNTCPDYGLILSDGFSGRLKVIDAKLSSKISQRERDFLECCRTAIRAFLDLVSRYRDEAKRIGNVCVADMFARVPEFPPEHFHEALQMIRIVSYGQHLAGMTHCGFGRIDQYLWPYYKMDVDSGHITHDYARELIEEFLICLNRDTELYQGVQQGDNGQSMVLGGCVPETGDCAVNDLTYLFLEATCEVRMIDPKINLRIDAKTPLQLLELGSRLTSCGLGFPQYLNDDVIIPALVKKGYNLCDARNYAVAACWEIVIPGKGIEEVNQGAVSFPFSVEEALDEVIKRGRFDEVVFRDQIRKSIYRQIRNILRWNAIRIRPSAFLSILFDEPLMLGKDVTEVAKYRNIGIHGAGVAIAAESITAILNVYRNRGMSGLRELRLARDTNYEHSPDLRSNLAALPKVGILGSQANDEVVSLFDMFADVSETIEKRSALNGRRIRPGSGSAMYYIWLSQRDKRPWDIVEPLVGATSNGRLKESPFPSSLSPSHDTLVDGILTVFRIFSKIDYSRIINGGPITIELAPSVFTDEDGVKKLAFLIAYFVKLGGQQLQLNVLDVEQLQDAMAHPELHKNLIVRVWGWSGYFCELAPEFQRQIISRHCYGS